MVNFWLTGMGGEHVLLKMGSADRPFRCQAACARMREGLYAMLTTAAKMMMAR